mgnify:CR=1 FL=1
MEIKILYPNFSDLLFLKGSPLQAFSKILGKSFYRRRAYLGYESELLLLFGYKNCPENIAALGCVTAKFDLKVQLNDLLRADPVFLKADQNRVFLFDATSLDISSDEAEKFIRELNDFYANEDISFILGTSPNRWYVSGLKKKSLNSKSPIALRGEPIEPKLSDINGLGGLKTLSTEIQMILHDSNVNKSRVESGKPPVNSMWFWGSQRNLPALSSRRVFVSSCEVVKALANSSGQAIYSDYGDVKTSFQEEHVKTLTIIFNPLALELEKKNEAEMFVEVLDDYKRSRIKKITLIDRLGVYSIGVTQRLFFWRNYKSLVARVNSENLQRTLIV